MPKSKILVTGANGFVGHHVVDRLQEEYDVIGVVSPRLPQQSQSDLSLDVNDRNAILFVLERYRPDKVIHLAAQTTDWFQDPAQMFATNLMGTINLYEAVLALREKDGYNPKILHVSSSEVYGKTTTPELIAEDAPFYPVNHYASSKAAADRVSYDYSQSCELNIVIARSFTHTGPGKKQGTFVSDMAMQIVHLENSPNDNEIYVGNLDAIRDYLDVRDVAEAYVRILEADTQPGAAFNVCSSKGVRIKDLLTSMLKLAKKEIVTKTDLSRMRPSDVPTFIGDSSRITRLTGWKPLIPLDDTLRETLDYWRQAVNENSARRFK